MRRDARSGGGVDRRWRRRKRGWGSGLRRGGYGRLAARGHRVERVEVGAEAARRGPRAAGFDRAAMRPVVERIDDLQRRARGRHLPDRAAPGSERTTHSRLCARPAPSSRGGSGRSRGHARCALRAVAKPRVGSRLAARVAGECGLREPYPPRRGPQAPRLPARALPALSQRHERDRPGCDEEVAMRCQSRPSERPQLRSHHHAGDRSRSRHGRAHASPRSPRAAASADGLRPCPAPPSEPRPRRHGPIPTRPRACASPQRRGPRSTRPAAREPTCPGSVRRSRHAAASAWRRGGHPNARRHSPLPAPPAPTQRRTPRSAGASSAARPSRHPRSNHSIASAYPCRNGAKAPLSGSKNRRGTSQNASSGGLRGRRRPPSPARPLREQQRPSRSPGFGTRRQGYPALVREPPSLFAAADESARPGTERCGGMNEPGQYRPRAGGGSGFCDRSGEGAGSARSRSARRTRRRGAGQAPRSDRHALDATGRAGGSDRARAALGCR